MAYDPPTSDPTVPGSASSFLPEGPSLRVGWRREVFEVEEVRPQKSVGLGGRFSSVNEEGESRESGEINLTPHYVALDIEQVRHCLVPICLLAPNGFSGFPENLPQIEDTVA